MATLNKCSDKMTLKESNAERTGFKGYMLVGVYKDEKNMTCLLGVHGSTVSVSVKAKANRKWSKTVTVTNL